MSKINITPKKIASFLCNSINEKVLFIKTDSFGNFDLFIPNFLIFFRSNIYIGVDI